MSENKNRSITIRVKGEEYRWMESAAQSEDLSVSSFLRRIFVKNLKESYPKLKPLPQWLLRLKENNESKP